MNRRLSPEESRNAIGLLYSKDAKNVLLGMELIDALPETGIRGKNWMIITWWNVIFKSYHAYFHNLLLDNEKSDERIEVQFPMTAEEDDLWQPTWGIYNTYRKELNPEWELYLDSNVTNLEIIFKPFVLTKKEIVSNQLIVREYIEEVKVYIDTHKYMVYRHLNEVYLSQDDSQMISRNASILNEIWDIMIADMKLMNK